MNTELWESVQWCLDNSSYCYVDVESGRRVDKKTKKFLDAIVEYAGENRELVAGSLEAAMEEGAQLFYHNNAVDKPTLEKAERAVLLDMQSANVVKQVFEAINDKNKENLRKRPFVQVIDMCWKLASK